MSSKDALLARKLKCLRDLWADAAITILKADKRSSTTGVNIDDYRRKVYEIPDYIQKAVTDPRYGKGYNRETVYPFARSKDCLLVIWVFTSRAIRNAEYPQRENTAPFYNEFLWFAKLCLGETCEWISPTVEVHLVNRRVCARLSASHWNIHNHYFRD